MFVTGFRFQKPRVTLGILPTLLFLPLLTSEAVDFKPPTAQERLAAVGPTEGLDETLRKALQVDDFKPVPVPKPGDWLAAHRETGQTFEQFVRSKPNRPDKQRNIIYLQPLGEFPQLNIPLLETLKQYASAYFGMPVKERPPLPIHGRAVTTRTNQFTGNRQVLTGDVLSILRKNLPPDAFCLMAITMEDLYPDPSWNFVFGQASLRDRVGVYSFARYDPAFYGQKRDQDYEKILLWRSCKVLVHEIAHMFGLMHCIYFKCAMNGSNHLGESDARPMHLCPVCLHKLHHSIGFDVVGRYCKLYHFYGKTGFEKEAKWTAQRVERLAGPAAAKAIIEQQKEK
jgi:archaemetzincin